MSGGSMNYIYSRLESDAEFDLNTPERVAFAKHLKLVAKALHDIEWVDSSDYGPGDDTAAIRACLGNAAPLSSSIEEVRTSLRTLCEEMKAAQKEMDGKA